MVTVAQLLIPALGAGAGYVFLKRKKKFGNLSGTHALIVGAIAGFAVQAFVTGPATLYPGRLRNSGAYAPLVRTGMQNTGSYIF